MAADRAFELFLKRLAHSGTILPEEAAGVRSLPHNVRTLPANAEIFCEGDRPTQTCLVVEGYLCRYKFVSEGGRQIMAFHCPGDVPDLQSLHLTKSDHYLGSLTASTVAFIPHASLRQLMSRHPRLTNFFWRDTLVNSAIFREWIINIGRRQAFGRMAHLICEQAVSAACPVLTASASPSQWTPNWSETQVSPL